jgi:molecular chaperone Hsp33
VSLEDVAPDDLIRPFQVEEAGVRGRLVRLGATVDTIVRRHAYPWPVARLLAEAIALTSVLAGALKFDGVFSLQAKGDGAVRMLVVDFVSPGMLRGYVQYDEAQVRALADTSKEPQTPVPRLMGGGYLAFTVDQGEEAERYQGIVPLEGATLAECAHKYFRDSEQVQTAIRVAAAELDDGAGGKAWRAGALMVQRLPEGDPALLARGVEIDPDEWAEDWHRAVTLLATARDDELLDPDLPPDTLLYRLFHEDGVRVFREVGLEFGCRCSRARAERVLEALPGPDLEEMTVGGQILVTCEFCSARYDFEATAFQDTSPA